VAQDSDTSSSTGERRYKQLKEQYDELGRVHNQLRSQILRDVEDSLAAVLNSPAVSDEVRAKVNEVFEKLRSTPLKSPEEAQRISNPPK
jgi:hypothetical protein